MAEDADVVRVVTRGFENLDKQIRERDDKVSSLSEQMIGVQLKLDQLKETLTNKSETDRLGMRTEQLEKANLAFAIKQAENAKWIKGLIASVIVLLIGYLLNFFIRIGLK